MTILDHKIRIQHIGEDRTSSDSLRNLLHLVVKTKDMETPLYALSLDAESISMNWTCVTEYQNLIYNLPMSMVVSNDLRSSAFPAGSGTKQGDPFSLLFIITLDRQKDQMNQTYQGCHNEGLRKQIINIGRWHPDSDV